MPDTHAGKGSVIGFTQTLGEFICPSTVGVDIGCGMKTIIFRHVQEVPNRAKLDNIIKLAVPLGMKHNETPCPAAKDFVNQFESEIRFIGQDPVKVAVQIGTLGGGNHFIELGKGEEFDGQDYALTVHSGSRNFGLQVCNYFQAKAKDWCDKYHEDKFPGGEFLPTDSEDGQNYLKLMMVAQRMAEINRAMILEEIVNRFPGLRESAISFETHECVHNYINFQDMVVRKGAISAHKGEILIIPFNMQDGMAICESKGNPEWNCSAPHGAGRIMSRSQAKKVVNGEELEERMKNLGIYTTTAHSAPDEAKEVYKSMDTILSCIEPTAEVIELFKPVYNCKSGD
jgi:RNA-splicing ligase RtcB